MARSAIIWWIARGTLALHAGFAAIAWFALPERIPTHFGGAGDPDAWSERTLFQWFALVAVSFGIQLLIQVVTLPRARATWNMPEKERFLQLTTEQQQPVFDLMRTFGGVSALCVMLTMFALHIGMYLTARGFTKGLPWYIHVAMFAPVLCMLVAVIPWSDAMKKAIVEASRPKM